MYYCTKYALTDGIWEVPESQADQIDGYLYVTGRHIRLQIRATDWFTDKDTAIARVKELTVKKIASHEKAINRLKTLDPSRSKPWKGVVAQ